MYKFRVNTGRKWSRWADWSTTSSAELIAESEKRGNARRTRRVPVTEQRGGHEEEIA